MAAMFRNRWWVVAASVFGLIVGTGAINIFAFGVFLKPVTADLGVGRGYFASGLVFNSLLTSLFCPIVGSLIDRWGTRRVMMPGILLYALTTAAYSQLTAAPFTLYLIVGLAGIAGAVQTPVAYAAIISQWFDRKRGVALGVAMAGVGLGVVLIPQIAAALIAAFGWRPAYLGLGLTVFLFAFVPVALFMREPPHLSVGRTAGTRALRAVSIALLPGVSFVDAVLRSWRFWALTLAFFLAVVAINGTLTNVIALLTDRGVPLQVATGALSAAGMALILGRILSGWCLDRFFGPHVAICFFLVPMLGIGLLASGAGGVVPLLGAILCGLGVGAEVDLMAFFVSRYFGLRSYGKVYGTMFAFFSFGTGLGPYIGGAVYDRFHSYGPAFVIFEGALFCTCLLFMRLGPYAFPARAPAAEPALAQPAGF